MYKNTGKLASTGLKIRRETDMKNLSKPTMGSIIEMNMKKVKVRYISDITSIFFEKGEVYDGYILPKDTSRRFIAFYLEDMDEEPGYYALPSSRFEVVEE